MTTSAQPGNRLQRFLRRLRTRLDATLSGARLRLQRCLQGVLALLTAQPLLLLFVVTFAVVAWLNPAKVGLALYGVSKLALFAYAGDRCDEWIFRKLRDTQQGVALGTIWKRKAWIISASILAGALVP